MIVLPTTYLGPVGYYATLFHADEIVIDVCEYYEKQTLRNRCTIATGQGPQTLSINVVKGNRPHLPISEVRLSDHGNWMHQHLYSLATYYGNTPFYEYYIDDIRQCLLQGHDGTLLGLNEALRQLICQCVGFEPKVRYSNEWMGIEAMNKGVQHSQSWQIPAYYQVAQVGTDQPFQPDMSILDLLFNKGPESVLVLRDCTVNKIES